MDHARQFSQKQDIADSSSEAGSESSLELATVLLRFQMQAKPNFWSHPHGIQRSTTKRTSTYHHGKSLLLWNRISITFALKSYIVLQIAGLKYILRSEGFRVSGKKPALIQRIHDHRVASFRKEPSYSVEPQPEDHDDGDDDGHQFS